MALKIIGAGMGRTGTASLKVALETLGIGHCYHMSEVLKNPGYTKDWIDAAEGNADWDKIFKGYSATVDNPGCNYWKELADNYPEAKVILTVRDADKWFDSTNETIHSVEFASFIKDSPFGEMVQKTIWDMMENCMQDRKHMVDFLTVVHQKSLIILLQKDCLSIRSMKAGSLFAYSLKCQYQTQIFRVSTVVMRPRNCLQT